MTMKIEQIDIASIQVPDGRRVVDPEWVEAIALDIDANGQLTPIEVVSIKGGYQLIAGAHRLAAMRKNFTQEIAAIVTDPKDLKSDAERKLREIAENLLRRELSVLDRAFDVAAWREIFEQRKGVVKPGRKAKSANSPNVGTNSDDANLERISDEFSGGFKEAAQRALGLSKNGVFRALSIAKIGEKIRADISLHQIASNQSELLSLAAQPEAIRGQICHLILIEEAATVAQAVAQIDKQPLPRKPEPFEKFATGFAKLKVSEQDRFFELNSAAIERWLAVRKESVVGSNG